MASSMCLKVGVFGLPLICMHSFCRRCLQASSMCQKVSHQSIKLSNFPYDLHIQLKASGFRSKL